MQGERVIALGLFDGVHLGHAALLRAARKAGKRLKLPSAALTFDPHPSLLVQGHAPALLNTVADREGLIRRLFQLDEVMVCPFDEAMMNLPWIEYVEDFLIGQLHAACLICGHDHRFGARAMGNPKRLREVCERMGVRCEVIPRVERRGAPVSSTRIRTLVATGDMETANALLGHPHCLTGRVVHGQGLGRDLGTPTANVPMPDGILQPAFGVYATRVAVEGRRYDAVTNVGVRPTVDGGDQVLCEPWLLDFSGDLYGQEIRIEFHRFLRPEKKFKSLEALRAAIARNAEETRSYFKILRNCEMLFRFGGTGDR